MHSDQLPQIFWISTIAFCLFYLQEAIQFRSDLLKKRYAIIDTDLKENTLFRLPFDGFSQFDYPEVRIFIFDLGVKVFWFLWFSEFFFSPEYSIEI